MVALLVLGAVFDDELGRQLRGWGVAFLLLGSMAMLSGLPHVILGAPPSWQWAYPIVLSSVAAGYGFLVGGRPFFATSGLILAGVLALLGSRGYALLRPQVAGLDRIALGLASFLVAALISLWKAGLLQCWLARAWRPARAPSPSVEPPAT
jgi:hypothetical protein